MQRWPMLLLLALCLAALVPPTAAAQKVGELAQKRREVRGDRPPSQQLEPIDVRASIVKEMLVETKKQSFARIAVGDGDGTVSLGPESRVRFTGDVLEQATPGEVDFFVLLGSFRAAFTPTPRLAAGEVRIETPTAMIRKRGTDLVVLVAPDGTTWVFVLEGEVAVAGKAGGEVVLPAGTGTVVRPDEPPAPPEPFPPGAGPLPPGGPAYDPDDWGGDPPRLFELELDLDLPRTDLQ